MLWLETGWADIFMRAKHYLATPQYWSWRLSGAAALSPDRPALADQEHSGTATGAALLACHEARSGPALLDLHPPIHVAITSLADYRTR
jgi:hypothetical protein